MEQKELDLQYMKFDTIVLCLRGALMSLKHQNKQLLMSNVQVTVLTTKGIDMKTDTTQISLYDLMAEDFSVWVQRNPKFGFDLCIEGDDAEERIEISGVHSYAMESFSDFCRSFLRFYDKLKDDEIQAA
jgi:hypothetical protein